jgi:DNA polymerase-3 subunit gamma/tau
VSFSPPVFLFPLSREPRNMAKKTAPADPAPNARDGAVPSTPEGYTVLARRYRPQNFEQIVGQEAVSRALVNALKSNRVAHAYLFTGARGVGKTSTARILAKCLNCVHGPTPTPCNECDICKSIASGEDVDVLEFDAASNRGIDEIRNIRNNVQYRPSRARFKIYIIDEVHMLSTPAFNALLKTLEEPPAHVKFIFATTDAQKIPVTILSRCQRFDLGGINPALIKQHLRSIVEKEGLQADDEALEMVSRRAGGSMRDAQSLLDQLLAFGGDRLTAEQVHQLLGTASEEHVRSLAETILSKDPKRTLEELDRAATRGFQMGELLEQLIAYWRDLMVARVSGEQAPDLSVSPQHRSTLVQQARALTLDTVLAGLDILSATKARLRDCAHARTLVEMALVRMSRLADLVPIAQVAQWVGQLRQEGAGGGPRTAFGASTAGKSVSPEMASRSTLKAVLAAPQSSPPAAEGTLTLTPETVGQVWPEVMRLAGTMLASDLSLANCVAISGPNTLVIQFPVQYNKAQEHCQAPNSVSRVEAALRKLTGRNWSVRVETAPVPAGGVPASAPETAEPARPRRNSREEAEKEPLIKRALEVLGAQFVRVDENFGAPVEGGKPSAAPPEEDT